MYNIISLFFLFVMLNNGYLWGETKMKEAKTEIVFY